MNTKKPKRDEIDPITEAIERSYQRVGRIMRESGITPEEIPKVLGGALAMLALGAVAKLPPLHQRGVGHQIIRVAYAIACAGVDSGTIEPPPPPPILPPPAPEEPPKRRRASIRKKATRKVHSDD